MHSPAPPIPNPYHKWHLVAYAPVLLTAAFAGLTSAQLTTDPLDENIWWIFATAAGFVVFSFWDLAIQDKWLAGIPRKALYRFTDSYMPLLLLFLSGFVSALISTWDDLELDGYISTSVTTAILLTALLVTIREMGSLGRVLKPKHVEEMDDEVRPVIKARLQLP